MSLHLYICTQFRQAWHIHLQFNNIAITRYAVGPAIDVVRRNYSGNHLHESGRSLDYSSDSSFSHCLVDRNFHYSALPRDDLVWSVIRGGQRRCNCDSAQEYMSTCSYFLELENVCCCVSRGGHRRRRDMATRSLSE